MDMELARSTIDAPVIIAGVGNIVVFGLCNRYDEMYPSKLAGKVRSVAVNTFVLLFVEHVFLLLLLFELWNTVGCHPTESVCLRRFRRRSLPRLCTEST